MWSQNKETFVVVGNMIQVQGKATIRLPPDVELPRREDGRLKYPIAPDGKVLYFSLHCSRPDWGISQSRSVYKWGNSIVILAFRICENGQNCGTSSFQVVFAMNTSCIHITNRLCSEFGRASADGFQTNTHRPLCSEGTMEAQTCKYCDNI